MDIGARINNCIREYEQDKIDVSTFQQQFVQLSNEPIEDEEPLTEKEIWDEMMSIILHRHFGHVPLPSESLSFESPVEIENWIKIAHCTDLKTIIELREYGLTPAQVGVVYDKLADDWAPEMYAKSIREMCRDNRLSPD